MTFQAKISASGKVALPADLRREFGLKPGDTLVFERDGEGFRVKSYAQVVRDAQAWAKQFVRPGVSAVDELIASRREEAARDDAEHEARMRQ